MERYDIAIIGAGVSGSIAAYILSKTKRVVVFEKKKLPRYKTCAGGITNKTLKFLEELGININNTLIENYIKEIDVKISNERKVLRFSKPIGILTYRDKFDYYLLKKSNADILDETKVLDVKICGDEIIVKTNRGEFYSKYLFGCDGATSIVKKKFFEREMEMGVAAQIEVNEIFDKIYIDFDIVKNGYAWIFPKRNSSSIGVGFIREHENISIRNVLKRFIKNLKIDYDEKSVRIHPLPYFIGRKNLVYKGRICICGDAANLIDPLTGEGTFNAIYSSYLASKALLEGNLNLYERYYMDTIYKEMRKAQVVSKIFYTKKEFSKYILLKTNFFENMLECICNEIRCYSKNYYTNILKLIPLYIISRIKI